MHACGIQDLDVQAGVGDRWFECTCMRTVTVGKDGADDECVAVIPTVDHHHGYGTRLRNTV